MGVSPSVTAIVLCAAAIICADSLFEAVWANDYDDLRVSSSTLNGGNYHSITPNPDAKSQLWLNDQYLNQIGKPLVAPLASSTPQPVVVVQRQPTQVRKSLPATKRPLSSVNPSSASAGLDRSDARRRGSADGCHWLPLREFTTVSFDMGDLIIRDTLEQPCYIVTMQAYVRLDDHWYFPLRNFRPHPLGAYTVEFAPSNDKHASERLVLNCSPPNVANSGDEKNTITNATLVSQERAGRVFAEAITVQVDCGYLVLRLRGDGTLLLLEEIAFYQDDDSVEMFSSSKLPNSNNNNKTQFVAVSAGTAQRRVAKPRAKEENKSSARTSLAPPSMQLRHLVFSSSNGNQDGLSRPLIVMPAYSRYICQRRVVLTGNNSVQLVLERFELKRLTNEPMESSSRELADSSGGRGAAPMERDLFVEGRPRRNARTATIIYKSPMNAVTTCPSGVAPQGQQQQQQPRPVVNAPLTSMMELSGLRQANDTMGTASANKWIFAGALQKSSAASSATGEGFRPRAHFLDSIVLLGLGLAWWSLFGATHGGGGRRRPIWAGAGAIY